MRTRRCSHDPGEIYWCPSCRASSSEVCSEHSYRVERCSECFEPSDEDLADCRRYLETVGAYYFSFEPTGCEEIDLVLGAVCRAGKAYHHTEGWTEGAFAEPTQRGFIQAVADAMAKRLRDR